MVSLQAELLATGAQARDELHLEPGVRCVCE